MDRVEHICCIAARANDPEDGVPDFLIPVTPSVVGIDKKACCLRLQPASSPVLTSINVTVERVGEISPGLLRALIEAREASLTLAKGSREGEDCRAKSS